MPLKDIPDHTHVNGTMKSAIHDLVDAPTRNPRGNCSNHAPVGGAARSGPSVAEPPTISEKEKVLPQPRHSARSVETFTSSIAILERHSGQVVFMSLQDVMRRSAGSIAECFCRLWTVREQSGVPVAPVPEKSSVTSPAGAVSNGKLPKIPISNAVPEHGLHLLDRISARKVRFSETRSHP